MYNIANIVSYKSRGLMKLKNKTLPSNQLDHSVSPWLGEYQDCFTFKIKPITQSFIERFASDLVKWAYNDNEALIISQFYLSKGISPQTYYRWINQHSILKEAHETALLCIGNRREIGALKRKFSETMIARRQHAYDSEWNVDKLRNKQDKIDVAVAIKQAEDLSPEKKNITVVMNCLKDHEKHPEPCDPKTL